MTSTRLTSIALSWNCPQLYTCDMRLAGESHNSSNNPHGLDPRPESSLLVRCLVCAIEFDDLLFRYAKEARGTINIKFFSCIGLAALIALPY